MRFVIRLAVQLLHFVVEGRAVFFFGARQRPGLPFEVPAFGIQPLRFFVMRNRRFTLILLIEIFGQTEFRRSQRPIGILRLQAFAQFGFAHGKRALVTILDPIAQAVDPRFGVNFGDVHAFVVGVSDFVGTHDAPLFIDPNAGRYVDHVVKARDYVLLVNQHRVISLARFDPRQRSLDAARVFGDRNDFKVLILEFAINCLPAWQVCAAASPRSPCHDQHFLAAKISERMQLAVLVGQREIRRLKVLREAVLRF